MMNNQGVVLSDKGKGGRERPWRKHKRDSGTLSKVYNNIYKSVGDQYFKDVGSRINYCASYLRFRKCKDDKKIKCKWKKLYKASFCKVRLCPTCQWRRSLLSYHQFVTCAHHVYQSEPNMAFVLLTVTVKNCIGNVLKDEITHLLKSWQRLTQRAVVKRSIKGWYRALEITYNEEDGTFHPHIHSVLVVNTTYFKHRFISQKKWTQLWRESAKLDYDPIIDVRKVRKKKRKTPTIEQETKALIALEEKGVVSIAAEVTKYTVKPSDIISKNNPEEVVFILDPALKGRQLTAYGGVLRDAYKVTKQQNIDKANLVQISESNCDDPECPICGSELTQVIYIWRNKNQNYYEAMKEVKKEV